MDKRFEFNGTGGALFVKLLVGALLSGITLGIYLPWFIVNIEKWMAESLILKTNEGDVRFEFNGTGGSLFVTLLVGALLTGITLGIYGAWFYVKLAKYFCENTTARTASGATYTLQFNGTGGGLFVLALVGILLTAITFGIYGAWFMCKLGRFFAENTSIMNNGTAVGGFAFNGQGGDLFVTVLVGYLLTAVTLGIYGAWFAVKLMKWQWTNSPVDLNGTRYSFDFTGTGGEYFVIALIGALLCIVTLYIYMPWLQCKIYKFQYEKVQIIG